MLPQASKGPSGALGHQYGRLVTIFTGAPQSSSFSTLSKVPVAQVYRSHTALNQQLVIVVRPGCSFKLSSVIIGSGAGVLVVNGSCVRVH